MDARGEQGYQVKRKVVILLLLAEVFDERDEFGHNLRQLSRQVFLREHAAVERA